MRKYVIGDVEKELLELLESGKNTQVQKIKKYIKNIEKVDIEFWSIKENEAYDCECENYIANCILLQKYKEQIEKKFEPSVDIIDAYNTLKLWELLSRSSSQKKGKRIIDSYTKKVIIKDIRKYLRDCETLSEREVEEYLRLLSEKEACEREIKKKERIIPQNLLIYVEDHVERVQSQTDNYDTLKHFIEQGIDELSLEDNERQKWHEIVRDISFYWNEDELDELKQKIHLI